MVLALCAWRSAVLAEDVAAVSLPEAEDFLVEQGSIAELSNRGQHYSAVLAFIDRGERANLSDMLAAARSAWALGLAVRARLLWEEILADRDFKGSERDRTVLSMAILELQEGNAEKARAVAEQAARELEPSELRAQLWLVIGESLSEQNAPSLAEGYYKKAVDEGSDRTREEAHYLLGECQMSLGRIDEARYNFAAIELSTDYTPKALRRLVEIDLTQRNYEGVLTWVDEGRDKYPSEFHESWLIYAYTVALLELGRSAEAQRELKDFRVRHSEKNPWYLVAASAFEAARIRRIFPEAELARAKR